MDNSRKQNEKDHSKEIILMMSDQLPVFIHVVSWIQVYSCNLYKAVMHTFVFSPS